MILPTVAANMIKRKLTVTAMMLLDLMAKSPMLPKMGAWMRFAVLEASTIILNREKAVASLLVLTPAILTE